MFLLAGAQQRKLPPPWYFWPCNINFLTLSTCDLNNHWTMYSIQVDFGTQSRRPKILPWHSDFWAYLFYIFYRNYHFTWPMHQTAGGPLDQFYHIFFILFMFFHTSSIRLLGSLFRTDAWTITQKQHDCLAKRIILTKVFWVKYIFVWFQKCRITPLFYTPSK